MKTDIKIVDVVTWENKQILDYLKTLDKDVCLVKEESSYYILINEKIVIEDSECRGSISMSRYDLDTFINELKEEVE